MQRNGRASAKGVHLKGKGVHRAHVVLYFAGSVPHEMILVFAAVADDHADAFRGDAGHRNGGQRRLAGHMGDGIFWAGHMALANAHLLLQDGFRDMGARGQVGGSFHMGRKVRAEAHDAYRDGHKVF